MKQLRPKKIWATEKRNKKKKMPEFGLIWSGAVLLWQATHSLPSEEARVYCGCPTGHTLLAWLFVEWKLPVVNVAADFWWIGSVLPQKRKKEKKKEKRRKTKNENEKRKRKRKKKRRRTRKRKRKKEKKRKRKNIKKNKSKEKEEKKNHE